MPGTDNKALGRNTPTCVGKTAWLEHAGCVLEKHPHVRGENWDLDRAKRAGLETPPRAWGKPQRAPRRRSDCRNTPTCVGKTLPRKLPSSLMRKHPHVRGENLCEAR